MPGTAARVVAPLGLRLSLPARCRQDWVWSMLQARSNALPT